MDKGKTGLIYEKQDHAEDAGGKDGLCDLLANDIGEEKRINSTYKWIGDGEN